jgi:hypothetical protein
MLRDLSLSHEAAAQSGAFTPSTPGGKAGAVSGARPACS